MTIAPATGCPWSFETIPLSAPVVTPWANTGRAGERSTQIESRASARTLNHTFTFGKRFMKSTPETELWNRGQPLGPAPQRSQHTKRKSRTGKQQATARPAELDGRTQRGRSSERPQFAGNLRARSRSLLRRRGVGGALL